MLEIIYKGFFIDEKSSVVLKQYECNTRLEKGIPNEHITFGLRPEQLFPISMMYKPFSIRVIGYGNDGENSGFQVTLPEELVPYYQGAETIHITTSISDTGKAMNTAHIEFQPITPFSITGQLGYYAGKRILFH